MSPRAAWRFARDEGPAAKLALAPLALPAAARAARSWLRERSGRRPARRFPGSTVSVGRITAGDAGSDLVAARVALGLRLRGHRVALATCGPRPRGGEPVTVVSDGRFVMSRFEACGAAPLVLAAHAAGVPVLAASDPEIAGWRALSAFGSDVLVLNDGFQCLDFHRDVDIVCLDGGLGLGNRWLSPRGPLRDVVRALGRAHAIAVVDPPLPEADERIVADASASAQRLTARRFAFALRGIRGGDAEAPAALGRRDVGLLAARSDAGPLRRTLTALGARIVAEQLFADGHRFRARDLRGLAGRAPLWVVPESDAVMIRASWMRGTEVRVLAIGMEIESAGETLDWIETRLR